MGVAALVGRREGSNKKGQIAVTGKNRLDGTQKALVLTPAWSSR